MIEIDLMDFLKFFFTDVPVITEVFDGMKYKKFILIEKVGTNYKNHIEYPLINLKCVAESMYEAAAMMNKVKKVLLTEATDKIADATINTEYNDSDSETKQYMYCAVFQFTYYTDY